MNDEAKKNTLTTAPVVYKGPLTWMVAVTVLMAGVLLPLLQLVDSDWLSRSGCVVVMLGIWSGLGGLIREKILDKRLMLRQRRAVRRLKRKYRFDAEVLAEELGHLEKRYAELADKHHSKLHLSVGVQEAALLLTGTFVWGFGDLIRLFI